MLGICEVQLKPCLNDLIHHALAVEAFQHCFQGFDAEKHRNNFASMTWVKSRLRVLHPH